MDAPFVYLVRFWVNPAGAAAVLRWLDDGHMRDVVAQPGFLWVRRVRLEQNSPEGWPGYLMIYGLESRDALQAYFNGPAPARFAQERKPFEHHLCMDRSWGVVDAAVS